MQIKSPKSTVVLEVHPSEVPVKKGDVLFKLSDLEENLVLSSIARALEENRAKIAEVQDEHDNMKVRSSLEAISYALERVMIEYGRIERIRQQEYEQSFETLTNLRLATKRTLSATIKWEKARTQLKVHVRNVEDSQPIYTLVGQILQEEYELVTKYIRRLTIKAPFEGTFSSEVVRGAPVELGHVLGVLTP